MREILFRGKLIATGEWAYGNFAIKPSGMFIITPDDTPLGKYGAVKPETVGQYTGLTDKNGKKIFEGDILKWDEKEWGCPHYNEIATWDYDLLGLRCRDWRQFCEVVGNIHDNHELLENKNGH